MLGRQPQLLRIVTGSTPRDLLFCCRLKYCSTFSEIYCLLYSTASNVPERYCFSPHFWKHEMPSQVRRSLLSFPFQGFWSHNFKKQIFSPYVERKCRDSSNHFSLKVDDNQRIYALEVEFNWGCMVMGLGIAKSCNFMMYSGLVEKNTFVKIRAKNKG